MRRHTALIISAAAGVLVAAHPSMAATKRFAVTDATGDANGVNSQSLGLPLPSTSTPADVSGADITKIEFVNVFKGTGKNRKANGFDVTLRLAAPMQAGTLITLTMNTSRPCGESSTIQLGYSQTSSLAICQSATPGGTSTDIGSWQLSSDSKSVTWSIQNIFKPGTKIDAIAATTSVFVVGVFDEATTDAVFSYGQ
jgi:hypothetical protein